MSQINHFIEALNREMGVTVEEAEEDEGSSVQLETIVSPGKIKLTVIHSGKPSVHLLISSV